MSLHSILSSTDITASGLSAERMRMDVVANNIANAYSTRSPNGGPYRRQQVLFSEVVANQIGKTTEGLSGVTVTGVAGDQSEFPSVYNPGHPDADANGFVMMPNVSLPNEMVDLLTASRGYEANLKSLEAFRRMTEQALELLRGLG